MATDDRRIKSACQELGIPTIMTSLKHKTGTDRVGEVAKKIKADIYVNIQGDEPLVDIRTIKSAIAPFRKKTKISVTNLMTEIKNKSELKNPTVPKVVFNAQKKAIFLSRLPIPYLKNSKSHKYYKQVCVYGFRRKALEEFCRLPRGMAERAEDIELLRFIENNIPVQMVEVRKDTIAVDTPSDLERVRNILAKPNTLNK